MTCVVFRWSSSVVELFRLTAKTRLTRAGWLPSQYTPLVSTFVAFETCPTIHFQKKKSRRFGYRLHGEDNNVAGCFSRGRSKRSEGATWINPQGSQGACGGQSFDPALVCCGFFSRSVLFLALVLSTHHTVHLSSNILQPPLIADLLHPPSLSRVCDIDADVSHHGSFPTFAAAYRSDAHWIQIAQSVLFAMQAAVPLTPGTRCFGASDNPSVCCARPWTVATGHRRHSAG